MKFPKSIRHYGLEFVKVMESDPDGNKTLGYTCITYPCLGTTRHLVSTWLPNKAYCESVMSTIHYTISQFIADYIRSVEILKKYGKDVAAREFWLAQANIAPFDPEKEEWPEVLNHHGLHYWRELEETPSKDLILKYTCRDYVAIGTLKLKVDTANPNERYKVAVLGHIMHSINQYLTDYFCFLEELRIVGKQAPVFDLSDPGTGRLLETTNH
jgi:hypothetical protein